jgi:hypothetical protein
MKPSTVAGPMSSRTKRLVHWGPSGRLILAGLLLAWPAASDVLGVNYFTELKPLLRERCYSCHGALKQKKELRLDTVEAMLKGGKDGPAIRRGEPDQSLLIRRVTATNLDERMPPEQEGEPLTPAQVRLLRDWIAAGAPAPHEEQAEAEPKEHWAFRPCVRPPVPPTANRAWVRNPIDAFIARQHAQHGLTPQPEAPRSVLLRRLYLDLIGLPPTPLEIAAALRDPSDRWYPDTVERLLADPRHGERWARHWMDIWRYSDWWGLGDQLRNSQKHIWHWRDWIIESLNVDLPYDEMVRQMLAADELYPSDLDKLRATGFLARNWFLFNRNQWLEETVEHVSKGFLGLTINCAKCHDHKYDPIPQADFYRMRAFFEPYHVRLEVRPGEPDLERDGIPCAFDGPPDTPTYRFVRGQENQPDKSASMLPGVPALLAFRELDIRPVSLPLDAWQPERRAWVFPAHSAAARKRVEAAEEPIPRLKQALASALRQEADLLAPDETDKRSEPAPPPTPPALAREKARNAVEEARVALAVAETALASAQADLAAVECRAEAARAAWACSDGNNDSALAEIARDRMVAAVKSERAALVAKARHALAEAELRLQKASDSSKETVEKEKRAARESLEKAVKTAEAPIKADDSCAQLPGAKWTPTRFLNSGTDDPTVKFIPRSSGRRRALAEWITDRHNPLTARVAANHIWMRHFGTPLVATIFEFGRKGTPPTHPELLDWLAAELMDSGWSMKHLHKLIVTSSAYRMSSSRAGGDANVAKDPDNLYLWRREAVRIEAEVVRDSILSLAGTLDPTIGGPSVPPAKQDDSERRSLYFSHSYNERNLFLTTFDEAGVRECYRREQSIVPQQALALTNSRLVHDAAVRIATRLSRLEAPDHGQLDDVGFIRRAFSALLGISASQTEIAASQNALENWRQHGKQSTDGSDEGRAHLIWALINHNDFVTLR